MNRILNSLERKFGNWAIPGLIRMLGILFFGSCLLGLIRPEVAMTFDFDLEKIREGEIWRVLTFVLAPSSLTGSPVAIVFAFFGMMLMFIFSDALEGQWGVFRTNLFVLWGYLSALCGAILMDLYYEGAPPMVGVYLGMSILFAFATYNPRFTIMMFFVIPTPIWIIAVFSGVIVGMPLLFLPWPYALFVILCLSNYLVFAVPMRMKETRTLRKNMGRRREFQISSKQEDFFHRCATCGATDVSHPDKEFRVGSDGEDYCTEHLPSS